MTCVFISSIDRANRLTNENASIFVCVFVTRTQENTTAEQLTHPIRHGMTACYIIFFIFWNDFIAFRWPTCMFLRFPEQTRQYVPCDVRVCDVDPTGTDWVRGT